jgi:hypothetical protein
VHVLRILRLHGTHGERGQVVLLLLLTLHTSHPALRDVSIRYCGNIAGLALVTLVNVRVLLLHYSINVYAAASAVLRCVLGIE